MTDRSLIQKIKQKLGEMEDGNGKEKELASVKKL